MNLTANLTIKKERSWEAHCRTSSTGIPRPTKLDPSSRKHSAYLGCVADRSGTDDARDVRTTYHVKASWILEIYSQQRNPGRELPVSRVNASHRPRWSTGTEFSRAPLRSSVDSLLEAFRWTIQSFLTVTLRCKEAKSSVATAIYTVTTARSSLYRHHLHALPSATGLVSNGVPSPWEKE